MSLWKLRRNTFVSVLIKKTSHCTGKCKNMYTHYDEPLFDYIIIKESDEFVDGYRTAHLFGVNYEDESKLIPCGYIDCFRVSPSCQFDFHENGGISVFCKDFSKPNGVGKVFARNSFTGSIVAMKDATEFY